MPIARPLHAHYHGHFRPYPPPLPGPKPPLISSLEKTPMILISAIILIAVWWIAIRAGLAITAGIADSSSSVRLDREQ